MFRKRRQHNAAFKAKVALEALKNIEPVHAIAAKHGVHPTQVSQWMVKGLNRSVSRRAPILSWQPIYRYDQGRDSVSM